MLKISDRISWDYFCVSSVLTARPSRGAQLRRFCQLFLSRSSGKSLSSLVLNSGCDLRVQKELRVANSVFKTIKDLKQGLMGNKIHNLKLHIFVLPCYSFISFSLF